MAAVRAVAFLGLLSLAAALAAAQPPPGEVAGFPGQGRVVWKAEGVDRAPLRLVRASYLPDPLVVKLVFELTRSLETEEVLFLEGRLGNAATADNPPITAVLLDRDGVPLAPLRGLYEGLAGRTGRGNRFRLLLQIPPGAWDRASAVEMEWVVPGVPRGPAGDAKRQAVPEQPTGPGAGPGPPAGAAR
jgi:hypothetical protein